MESVRGNGNKSVWEIYAEGLQDGGLPGSASEPGASKDTRKAKHVEELGESIPGSAFRFAVGLTQEEKERALEGIEKLRGRVTKH